jgi:hypothetical protein
MRMWIGFICVRIGSSYKDRLSFYLHDDKYFLEGSAIHTMVLIKNQFFMGVTLCRWVNTADVSKDLLSSPLE